MEQQQSPKPYITKYAWWCLFGTAVYFAVSAVILKGFAHLEKHHGEWDTKSTLFEQIYYRGVYFTKYLSFTKFGFHYVMMLVGYTFVNIVTLQNVRKDPRLDQHMSTASWWKTVFVVAPGIFFISQIGNLRGKHDLSSYCNGEKEGVLETSVAVEMMAENVDPIVQLFDSIGKSNYFVEALKDCHIYTESEVFHYNLLWLLAFYLGLQWTHAGQGILSHFTLDWNIMKNWPPILWAVFFALVAGVLLLVFVLVNAYSVNGVLREYAVLEAIIFSWFFYKSRGAKDIHVHHYTLMMVLQSLCCYQSVFITVVAGAFNGIMIEGASRWGYDPVFVYPTDVNESQTSEVLKQLESSSIKIENQRLNKLMEKYEERELKGY